MDRSELRERITTNLAFKEYLEMVPQVAACCWPGRLLGRCWAWVGGLRWPGGPRGRRLWPGLEPLGDLSANLHLPPCS
jgi:hypothetical protein